MSDAQAFAVEIEQFAMGEFEDSVDSLADLVAATDLTFTGTLVDVRPSVEVDMEPILDDDDPLVFVDLVVTVDDVMAGDPGRSADGPLLVPSPIGCDQNAEQLAALLPPEGLPVFGSLVGGAVNDEGAGVYANPDPNGLLVADSMTGPMYRFGEQPATSAFGTSTISAVVEAVRAVPAQG